MEREWVRGSIRADGRRCWDGTRNCPGGMRNPWWWCCWKKNIRIGLGEGTGGKDVVYRSGFRNIYPGK